MKQLYMITMIEMMGCDAGIAFWAKRAGSKT